MTTPWQAHQMAVALARVALAEVQEAISIVTGKQEEAMRAIIVAVGEGTHIETARNAVNFTTVIAEMMQAGYESASNARAELDRYVNGF